MIPAWPLPAILSLISEQCNFGAHYSELGEVTDEPSLRREVRQSYQSVQLAVFWRAVVPTVWHACDYGGGPPLSIGEFVLNCGEVTDEPSLRREVRQSYQSVQLAIFWRAVVPTVWHACDYGGGPPLSIGELVLNCGEAANEALNRTRNDEVPNQQLERVEPGLAACRASSETKNSPMRDMEFARLTRGTVVHHDRFGRVYPDRSQHKYGFWRPVMHRVVHDYLKRGDLREGFARVRCPDCGHNVVVGFSCKQRCIFYGQDPAWAAEHMGDSAGNGELLWRHPPRTVQTSALFGA